MKDNGFCVRQTNLSESGACIGRRVHAINVASGRCQMPHRQNRRLVVIWISILLLLTFTPTMNHHDPSSSSSTPISHLIRLPPELIDNVLLHVPPHLLQRTALSLLQVFPDYPLSLRHLWTHLIVGRAQQLMPLWRKLKEEGAKVDGGMTKPVKTFAMVSVSRRRSLTRSGILERRCRHLEQVS